MKLFAALLIALLCLSCDSNKTNIQPSKVNEEIKEQVEEIQFQENEIEKQQTTFSLNTILNQKLENGFQIFDSIRGDLDNDGIDELVVAYNYLPNNDSIEWEVLSRDAIIYQQENGEWSKWKQSNEVLLGVDEGGIMGDPYEGMEIKNGVLLIHHFGGSSWKWSETDKYRFQDNDLYLIGYSSIHGRLCDYWIEHDFNLLTGRVTYESYQDDCGEEDYEPEEIEERKEEFYQKGVKIKFEDRKKREVTISSPTGEFGFNL